MSIELKIKVKNLADEARTIRKEEQKLHGMEKWKLQHHRKTKVRDAARRTLIAYQWIRGKSWTPHVSYNDFTRFSDVKEIERMVRKYGTGSAVEQLPKLTEALYASRSGDNHAENACSNAA